VSTHYSKITELANILAVAKVPWWYKNKKKKIIKQLKKLKKIGPL